MPCKDFLQDHHIVSALTVVADAFAGGVTTDYISLENYRRVTFVIIQGDKEDTCVSNLVTVNASDDASGTTTTAMAFQHRSMTYTTSADTWGALTSAAAAGYNFNANNTADNTIHTVEVTADEVQAAQAGAQFVSLTVAETANKTVTAGIIAILSDPRYPGPVPKTAIA